MNYEEMENRLYCSEYDHGLLQITLTLSCLRLLQFEYIVHSIFRPKHLFIIVNFFVITSQLTVIYLLLIVL